MVMAFEEYLGIEQAKALLANMRVLVLSSALINALLVIILWPQFSQSALLLWLAIASFVVAMRWWTLRSYTTLSINSDNYQRQLYLHAFWSSCNGLIWGGAALVFQDSTAPIYSLFLICALTGYISVTLISNTIYLPQFLGFIVAAAVPYVLSYLILGGMFYAVLCAYAVIYTLVMLAFGKVANNNYIRAKRVEFENAGLLDRLTQEKQIATRAVTHKNQFLAATSHDLRQPLHGIGLYIDALTPRMQDPVSKDIVGKLKISSDVLNELLHGLLEISRLDANAVSSAPIHTRLVDIVDRFIKECETELDELPIELKCQIDEELFVFVDPNLCERILRNILNNALKYTHQGLIKLSTKVHDKTIQLSVSDSGIGVPAEKLQDIFGEFTQLHNPERDRTKGLGLGLSIVKRLSELQNIEFNFESEVGVGSTFTLHLPKGDASMAPLHIHTKQSTIKNLCILCIDDEQTIRDGMRLIVDSWQCKALIAADRADAFKHIHEHDDHIDIIISDLRLREGDDGIQVISAIREELNLETPAIILTGDTETERLNMVKLPNLALMHKPIAAMQLRGKIEQLLSAKD